MNSTRLHRLQWDEVPPRDLAREGAVAADWDRLNAARLDLPFLSAGALAAALDAFGRGRERLFVARSDGRPVAMFIVTSAGRGRCSTFQPSQVPLAAWVAEADWPLESLAETLLRSCLHTCLVFSVTAIDPLAGAPAALGLRLQCRSYIDTAWIDIEGSFDDYWAARGKNLRQNLRKQRNRLVSEGVQTQLRLHTLPAEMAPALARYGALESAGWKAGEGTSIASDNVQGRYYTNLFVAAACRGEARIYEYLFDGRSVAMNLCLLRGGVLTVLKTAYDESVKQYSPASLLREEELQSFFALGEVQRVEYYGRLMDWHVKLTDRKRTLHHLTVYRWPVLKALAVRRAAKAARLAGQDDARQPITSTEAAPASRAKSPVQV